jgi:hypothetical protein
MKLKSLNPDCNPLGELMIREVNKITGTNIESTKENCQQIAQAMMDIIISAKEALHSE